MRKILFKGISKCNNNWVYGDLIQKGDQKYIASDWLIEGENDEYDSFDCGYLSEVFPETVSQSLEMHDRHNVLTFENDIVEFVGCFSTHRYLIWWDRECCMMTAVPLDGIYFNGQDYGNVEYPNFDYSTFCLMMQDPWGDFRDIKVIGNIHDNPELLEEMPE